MLVAYKIANKSYICVECVYKNGNLLNEKNREGREVVFDAEIEGKNCPKCSVCGKRLNKIDPYYHAESKPKTEAVDHNDPNFVDVTQPLTENTLSTICTEKAPTAIVEQPAKKKRGRPAKNPQPTDNVSNRLGRKSVNSISLTALPTIKRGRGRPKGSKNKPKVF